MDQEKVQMSGRVIDILDEELEYQNQMAGTERSDKTDYGIPGQLLTISRIAQKAQDAWVDNRGNDEALEEVRKLVAAGIRVIERNDCPRRGKKNVDYHPPKTIWE